MQLPATIEHLSGSATGSSLTDKAAAVNGVTGNPSMPSFSLPVINLRFLTDQVNPPAMRRVGTSPMRLTNTCAEHYLQDTWQNLDHFQGPFWTTWCIPGSVSWELPSPFWSGGIASPRVSSLGYLGIGSTGCYIGNGGSSQFKQLQ